MEWPSGGRPGGELAQRSRTRILLKDPQQASSDLLLSQSLTQQACASNSSSWTTASLFLLHPDGECSLGLKRIQEQEISLWDEKIKRTKAYSDRSLLRALLDTDIETRHMDMVVGVGRKERVG